MRTPVLVAALVVAVYAQSGWDRVGDDGTMKPGSPADATVIRRLPLAP